MIRTFIRYYKPHRKLFAADMFCSFTIAVLELFYPMVTRNMINDYIPNRNLRLIVMWGVILLVIYLVKAALNYFVQFYGHVIGVRMQATMRKDMFSHLQKLPFKFFDENKSGSIMSRIINDLMEITELAHHGPEDLFVSVVMLIGSFVILCTINTALTLIIFALLPFLVWFALSKRRKMSAAFTQTRVEIAEVNANLENSILGIRVTKAYNNADHELEKFEESNGAFVRARDFAYRTMAEFHSGMNLMVDVMNLVVLIAGGIFTYFGVIDFGDLVAYMLYVSMFIGPVRRLIGFVEQYQNGMTGFKRFSEIMDAAAEYDDPDAVEISDVKGAIRFDNVSFSYDEAGSNVLDGVSIDIQPGRTVALVGPSGSGKTTLCHLVARFYEIEEGAILLDGTDIRGIKSESLRRNIGIVQQDTFLFTGTIYDNIAYGDLSASKEQVVEAAKRANIHDYVAGLPDGYDTFVGERGVKLSGGQKQRVSIARAFLKNPPILILDEATSSLDNATEALIQEALEELCRDRTTLVVAHRLSTIKNADEIIVLTADGIAERGSHEQLIQNDGLYNALYKSQFRSLTE